MSQEDRLSEYGVGAPLARWMEEEAARVCRDVRARAADEAARLEEEAGKRREALLAEGRLAFAPLVREVRDAVVGQARWEAETLRVRLRGEITGRVLAACQERLGEAYGASVLEALVLEALERARDLRPDGAPAAATLRVAPSDRKACEDLVGRLGLDLAVEADDGVVQGVVLQVDGTPHRVRNTLPDRLRRLEPRLRERLADRLASLFRKADDEGQP